MILISRKSFWREKFSFVATIFKLEMDIYDHKSINIINVTSHDTNRIKTLKYFEKRVVRRMV